MTRQACLAGSWRPRTAQCSFWPSPPSLLPLLLLLHAAAAPCQVPMPMTWCSSSARLRSARIISTTHSGGTVSPSGPVDQNRAPYAVRSRAPAWATGGRGGQQAQALLLRQTHVAWWLCISAPSTAAQAAANKNLVCTHSAVAAVLRLLATAQGRAHHRGCATSCEQAAHEEASLPNVLVQVGQHGGRRKAAAVKVVRREVQLAQPEQHAGSSHAQHAK